VLENERKIWGGIKGLLLGLSLGIAMNMQEQDLSCHPSNVWIGSYK